MPDNDLGTAHGRVEITSDTVGVEKAAAALGALNAQGAITEKQFNSLQQSLNKHEQQVKSNASAVDDLRSKHEGLVQRVQEAKVASENLTQKEKELDSALLNVAVTSDDLAKKTQAVSAAKRESVAATKAAEQAQRAFNNELQKSNAAFAYTKRDAADLVQQLEKIDKSLGNNVQSFGRFNDAKDKTRKNIRGLSEDVEQSVGKFEKFRNRVEGAKTSLDNFSSRESVQALQSVAEAISTVRNVLFEVLAYGSAAGGIGLLLGGGSEGLIAMVASLTQMVGLVGLLPGLLSGAAAAAGVLAVGMHGVMESLGSINDPMKFFMSLRELGPITRQAMLDIHSFYASFRGAMMQVQDSIFAPILNDIRPLVMTYLPLLMHAGQEIGGIFGQAGHLFAEWLQAPATIQTIQQFLHNVAEGLRAALPAVQAFSNAWLTISAVGGGFFQQIGTGLAKVAQEFNGFISTAAQNGSLQQFIQYGIDSFMVLARNIKDVTEGLFNIFQIGNQYGGGFLEMFRNIGQEFLNWTRSASGQASISNFFQTLTEAGKALHPIMHQLGEAFVTVVGAIVHLGVAIAPGIGTFFTSLNSALKTLSPLLVQAAPAFNTFLEAVGKLVVQVVQQLGPALPGFLTNFAQAAIELVGPLSALAGALADFLKGMTPDDIKILIIFAGVVQALVIAAPILAGAFAILADPIGLVIAAIVALGLAFEHFYESSDGFRDFINGIGTWFSNIPQVISDAWHGVEDWFAEKWNDIKSWGAKVASSFAEGIESGVQWVKDALHSIADPVVRFLRGNSPTQEGPLSSSWSDEWGAKLSGDYASGIASGSGGVAGASSSVAGAAKDSFTSAGDTITVGGQYVSGTDGFSQWIKNLTADMRTWSKILQDSSHVLTSFALDGLKAVDTFARLWKGGDNELTRPGGFDQGAKPFMPGAAIGLGAEDVPGVPKPDIFGNLHPTPGGDNPADVPGVPGSGLATGAAAKSAAPAAPAGQPAQGAGNVAGITPAQPDSGGSPNYKGQDADLAKALKSSGFTDSQIKGLIALNGVETGNWSHPESIMGFTNEQTGPGIAAHVSGFKEMFDRRQKTGAVVNVGQPESGMDASGTVTDPAKYAKWLLKLEGYSATTDHAGNKYPEGMFVSDDKYAAAVAGAYQGAPGAGPSKANTPTVDASQFGGINLQDQETSTAGAINPSSLNLSTIPVAVQKYADDCIDASARIILSHAGINKTEDELRSVIPAGTNIGTQAAGLNQLNPAGKYVPFEGSGGSQEKMFNAIKASIDNGTGSVLNVAPGSSLAGHTFAPGHFIAVTGYNPDGTINVSDTANGKVYSVTAADAYQATRGRGIVAGTGTGPPPVAGKPPPGGGIQTAGAPSSIGVPGPNDRPYDPVSNPNGVLNASGQATFGGPPQSGGEDVPASQIAINQLPYPNMGQKPIPYLPNEANVKPSPILPGAPNDTHSINVATGVGTGPAPGPGNMGDVPKGDVNTFAFGSQNMNEAITKGISSVGGMADSVFASINSVIDSISAGADLAKKVALLPKDSETVISMIKDVQQFITTAAQIAKTVSQVSGGIGQLVGAGASGDPSGIGGMAAGAFQAVSAISGLIGDALQATNLAITTGIEIYHEVGKYVGDLAGFTLGGGMTGWLGGNTQMLLNTNNGQLYTYNSNNPLAKNTLNPGFQSAYTQTNSPQQLTPTIGSVNVYAGPGQTTGQMMSDTMWMVQTGGTQVVSAAGKQ